MGICGFIFRRWIMTSFPEFNGNSLIRNKISLLSGAKQAQQPNTRAITTNSWGGGKCASFKDLSLCLKYVQRNSLVRNWGNGFLICGASFKQSDAAAVISSFPTRVYSHLSASAPPCQRFAAAALL